MQIDAPNRDFRRRCEKQGGMAQSAGHFVKIPILSNADVNEVVENIFPSIRESALQIHILFLTIPRYPVYRSSDNMSFLRAHSEYPMQT